MTRDEFFLRYYRWSVADAQREFEQHLPLLRLVKGPSALASLQYLESLAADERQALMLAFVKQTNGRALELLGEKLSSYEQEMLSHYRDNIMPLFGGFLEKRLFDSEHLELGCE